MFARYEYSHVSYSEKIYFSSRDKILWKKAKLILLLEKALDFILPFLPYSRHLRSFQFLKGLSSPLPLFPLSKFWNASLSHARFPNQWGEGGAGFISKFNSKSSRFFHGRFEGSKKKGRKTQNGACLSTLPLLTTKATPAHKFDLKWSKSLNSIRGKGVFWTTWTFFAVMWYQT